MIDELSKRGVDVDAASIEDPATRQRKSIRDAINTGLLDIVTGEVINSDSGRRVSLPKAVHMRLLDAEEAKPIMETLNQSLEELDAVLQVCIVLKRLKT